MGILLVDKRNCRCVMPVIGWWEIAKKKDQQTLVCWSFYTDAYGLISLNAL